MCLGSKSALLFFSVEERLANYGLRAKKNCPMSGPASRASVELSLHAVCGCVLTTEVEMSGGNTDTGPTGRAPSGVYGTLTNSCSGTLKVKVKVAQSCPTLCSPMGCNLPVSSVHGILQARNWSELPWPPPGDLPYSGIEPTSLMSPGLAGRFFTTVPPGKPICRMGTFNIYLAELLRELM